jgi:hypothetical protein
MSRKKKKHQESQISPIPSAPPAAPLPSSEEFTRQMTFDAMEDRIRGEEMMQAQENKKLKEAQDVKKQADEAEVDKRLEQLRKQLGLKK